MKHWPRICLLGIIFVFALGLSMALAEVREVRVAWVPDGDTLILDNREVVRLKGIDAPETGYNGEPGQYFAREAAERLEELVMDRSLTMKTGQVSEDRYGRTLAYVYLPSGEKINVLLVEEGLAFYYPHPDQDEAFSGRIYRAQQRAVDQGLGFWPEVLAQEPKVEGWPGNKRSRRFHHPDCGYGQRIADHNMRMFSSLGEAFYAGFAPCRRCTPWPAEER